MQSRTALSVDSSENSAVVGEGKNIEKLKSKCWSLGAFVARDPFEISPNSPIGEDMRSVGTEPPSSSATISSPCEEGWHQAMRQETCDLIANDTYTLNDLPPDRKAI